MKQNKRIKKQEMTQNRRKQEKTQNQRRYMDVYSLSGKHENGSRMLEFSGDHNLAGTHNLKKLTVHMLAISMDRSSIRGA